MPIRLLATDLDGTLLGIDRRVSEGNRNAVRRCLNAGIHVVLASGRNITGVLGHVEALDLNGPLVCCNGAHVLMRPDLELEHHTLSTDICQTLLTMGSSRGLHVHFYSRERLLFVTDDGWGKMYLGRLEGVAAETVRESDVLDAQITKAMFVAPQDTIAALHAECLISSEFALADLTLSESEYLEFLPKHANKGSGLRAVAAELGIPRHETAAIGDYINDLPMLEWVGVSGAVSNAAPEVKAIVKVQVGTNEAGGVAQFIDSYVLNARE